MDVAREIFEYLESHTTHTENYSPLDKHAISLYENDAGFRDKFKEDGINVMNVIGNSIQDILMAEYRSNKKDYKDSTKPIDYLTMMCYNICIEFKINIFQEYNIDPDFGLEITPLEYAADYNENDVVRIFLEGGANLFHALELAKDHYYSSEMIIVLLGNCPNFNKRYDENGNTALHLAVIKKDIDICNLLLQFGSNTAIRNNDKKTPLDITSEWKVNLEQKKNMLDVIYQHMILKKDINLNQKIINQLSTNNTNSLTSLCIQKINQILLQKKELYWNGESVILKNDNLYVVKEIKKFGDKAWNLLPIELSEMLSPLSLYNAGIGNGGNLFKMLRKHNMFRSLTKIKHDQIYDAFCESDNDETIIYSLQDGENIDDNMMVALENYHKSFQVRIDREGNVILSMF